MITAEKAEDSYAGYLTRIEERLSAVHERAARRLAMDGLYEDDVALCIRIKKDIERVIDITRDFRLAVESNEKSTGRPVSSRQEIRAFSESGRIVYDLCGYLYNQRDGHTLSPFLQRSLKEETDWLLQISFLQMALANTATVEHIRDRLQDFRDKWDKELPRPASPSQPRLALVHKA